MGTRMSGALSFRLEKPVRIFRQMEQYNFSSRKVGTGAAVPFDNVYFFSWEKEKELARALLRNLKPISSVKKGLQ